MRIGRRSWQPISICGWRTGGLESKGSGFMSLEEVRSQIDAIDGRIVELLGARQQLVFQAATYKRNPDEVRAPKRREQM
ncbi:chorismate mutase, partial [Nocardia concava]|uniref:chorismate mutase n=1 Tax=Nocardia concava TaxID=257281 RepID=UPI001C3F206F